MFKAYGNFWKKYVDFEGRASRSDYWFVELVNVIIAVLFLFIVTILSAVYGSQAPGSRVDALFYFAFILYILYGLYLLAIFIPTLSITVRRLRDGGFHWAFIFFTLIPFFGGIVIFIFMLMPSVKKGRKRNS